jgi:F-type H+-transporting ATPase subunit b
MESTLNALGGILLRALPTFFLVLLLHFYLKRVFFGPLDKILKQRYDATEGARKAAEASLARAEAKAAEYEAAIRSARHEVYQEQEKVRLQWREEQASKAADARAKAGGTIKDAQASIAAQVEEARRTLRAESESLADEIVNSVLRRRA